MSYNNRYKLSRTIFISILVGILAISVCAVVAYVGVSNGETDNNLSSLTDSGSDNSVISDNSEASSSSDTSQTVSSDDSSNSSSDISPSSDVPQSGTKVCYLTFDDGPGPYTEELLKILDKYDAKVTFFVVNGKYNDLIKKEYEAGHTVAIHSYCHTYKTIYSSTDAYYDDFYKMRDVIYKQTGVYTNLFRFPGGSSNKVSIKHCKGIMSQLVKTLPNDGFFYFDWNVSSGDAGETTSTDQVVSNVINGIKGKDAAIVLQHDIKKFSVDAVEEIIKWGLANGYTFKALDSNSPGFHHKVNN